MRKDVDEEGRNPGCVYGVERPLRRRTADAEKETFSLLNSDFKGAFIYWASHRPKRSSFTL